MFKSVSEFAVVRARLDAGQPLDAALAGSGVRVSDWHHQQIEMLAVIGSAVDDGDPSHSLADYQQAYQQAWQQLVGEPRPLPITVAREEDAFKPRPRPQAPEEDELAPDTALGETASLDTSILAALTSSPLAETNRLDVALLTAASVPFTGKNEPPAIAPFEIHPELGGTTEMDAKIDLNASSVLPSWTPDRYAVLVAVTETAHWADRLQSYSELGIKNEDHRREIDAQMEKLFASDGDAKDAYDDHLAFLRGDL